MTTAATMRTSGTIRGLRILGWVAAGLLLLPILAIAVILIGLNIGPGQTLAAQLVGQLTGGMVIVDGLGGRFPDALRVARIELRDTQGVWMTVTDAALDWTPSRLLGGEAHVDMLHAASLTLARMPAPAAPQPAGGSTSSFSLPVRVAVGRLLVDRADLGAAVAGVAASLVVDGSARLANLQQGEAAIDITRLDGPGRYTVRGQMDDAGLDAALDAREPPHGFAATLAGLPDIGALAAQAAIKGPWSALGTQLHLTAGPMRADAGGTIDTKGQSANLTVSAQAPAMAPAPGIAWQSVALDAHVAGPFTRPDVTGTARLEGVAASGAALRVLTADLSGNQGHASVKAVAEGIRVPGPKPDLLEAAPLTLTADATLDAPDRPARFELTHPLLHLQGTATTAGNTAADAMLTVPSLAPLVAIGGVDLQGSTTLHMKAAMQGGAITADIDGPLAVTGGLAPAPGLIGPSGMLGATVAVQGADMTLSRLTLNGAALVIDAQGSLAKGIASLDGTIGLSNLSVLAPTAAGQLKTTIHVQGPADSLVARIDAQGDVGAPGIKPGPITARIDATGLPGAPAGTIMAEGTLGGAPLRLAVAADRAADGELRATIRGADWKSAHAAGELTLAPNATLPLGKIDLRIARLADLQPFVGQPFVGDITATADLGDQQARITVQATSTGLPGTAEIGRANLSATIRNPLADPVVESALTVEGLRAGGIGGDLRLTADGPQSALGLRLSTTLTGLAGADVATTSAATLDVPGKRLAVAALATTWKGETIRLLAPTRISFADGAAVDRLRLGLRDAVLDLAGRLSPTLDLTASLRNVTADLARIAAPDLQAAGSLQADARLTGTPAQPAGTVRLTATGLRLRTGPAAALPAAGLTATATLAGGSARLDSRLTAGANDITARGTIPLTSAGPLDLRATGGIDLTLLDPILTANGQRVKGRIALDATVTGTSAAPRANGTLRWTNGEVQDFAQGARISAIDALIEASGETIRVARFTGHAGQGTLGVAGTVGLAAPMPIDLTVTARNAAPLDSDRLTAVLTADLAIHGAVQQALNLTGQIHIPRAEIRVPERLPTQVAVLNVRRPGDKPPPPPAPAPEIGLDLTIDSPGQIFVRGRGVDAELEGHLHISGTTNAPRPDGRFKLRRGTFSLAGTVLTFTTGEVGFDGSGKIDPTLNFVATTANAGVIANLNVTGYASAPKITLTSTPELPQDEILAQLLFHTRLGNLGPLQYAQIAQAVTQLSGSGGGGFDPLTKIRQGLGLDRLSVGGTGAVEAGRYVAPGVYVGAKQATSGGGSQATVQIDLAKGLKLETNVGASGGSTPATGAAATDSGTNVGITYQFEY